MRFIRGFVSVSGVHCKSMGVSGAQCGLVRNAFAPILGGKYKGGNKVSMDEPTQEEL